MDIKKAVIPAAGLGTRFLPVTKSMPKEMLPIIDKPVIHYVVEEAIRSGIEDILIITGRGKRAIEDYFDTSPELELHLKRNNKKELEKVVREISSLADIHYIRQKEPRGLGDAILKAEKHVGDEPFAVLLGDDILINDIPATKQLIEVFSKVNSTVIGVERVPFDRVYKYGIIDGVKNGELYEVRNLVEKPRPEEAPSNLGIAGRYILTPDIFDCVRETKPGVGGEIQLTDALKLLLQKQKIYAYEIRGERYDIGDKLEYVRAILDFALERADLKEAIIEYARKKFT
ncbi:UTP--glucose-1-phosphate uridylyltransferase GalU [Geoglobus acetivorans]|uniref:UTP--glucose-1-phosphate uridylyltransferase n=1 Tax=Geoglobus acetivorans TaxID=565033 RepID=A0ABZ3H4M2_GEOAI|nr:UTP--glucose-1-phosphate uridylyltransferase GalU [Geoglobus acetivorans]